MGESLKRLSQSHMLGLGAYQGTPSCWASSMRAWPPGLSWGECLTPKTLLKMQIPHTGVSPSPQFVTVGLVFFGDGNSEVVSGCPLAEMKSAMKFFQAQPRQPQAMLGCAWETLINFVLEQFHTHIQSVLITIALPSLFPSSAFPYYSPFPTLMSFYFVTLWA